MSIKIGMAEKASNEEQLWADTSSPYNLPIPDPDDDRSEDPFVQAAKKNDFSFLEKLLIPKVKKIMLADPKWAGNEGLIDSLVGQATRELISKWMEPPSRLKCFQAEIDVIGKAVRLRNGGKTDAEILEILKADGDLA